MKKKICVASPTGNSLTYAQSLMAAFVTLIAHTHQFGTENCFSINTDPLQRTHKAKY